MLISDWLRAFHAEGVGLSSRVWSESASDTPGSSELDDSDPEGVGVNVL